MCLVNSPLNYSPCFLCEIDTFFADEGDLLLSSSRFGNWLASFGHTLYEIVIIRGAGSHSKLFFLYPVAYLLAGIHHVRCSWGFGVEFPNRFMCNFGSFESLAVADMVV